MNRIQLVRIASVAIIATFIMLLTVAALDRKPVTLLPPQQLNIVFRVEGYMDDDAKFTRSPIYPAIRSPDKLIELSRYDSKMIVREQYFLAVSKKEKNCFEKQFPRGALIEIPRRDFRSRLDLEKLLLETLRTEREKVSNEKRCQVP